jgi:hypothetical protein
MMATDVIRSLCIAYPDVAHALRKLAKVRHSSPKLQTAASLLGSHSRSMCTSVYMPRHAPNRFAMRLGFDEGNVGLDGRLDWRVCRVG